jgi:hypothetical protein
MRKADDEPRAPRRGWLKNGNPPGDPNGTPRCGAKTRRGIPCKGPAMANGRCRMHGGASTGPRTPEGLRRSQRANWKHGFFSARSKAERRLCRQLLCHSKALLHRVVRADMADASTQDPAPANSILHQCAQNDGLVVSRTAFG